MSHVNVLLDVLPKHQRWHHRKENRTESKYQPFDFLVQSRMDKRAMSICIVLIAASQVVASRSVTSQVNPFVAEVLHSGPRTRNLMGHYKAFALAVTVVICLKLAAILGSTPRPVVTMLFGLSSTHRVILKMSFELQDRGQSVQIIFSVGFFCRFFSASMCRSYRTLRNLRLLENRNLALMRLVMTAIDRT